MYPTNEYVQCVRNNLKNKGLKGNLSILDHNLEVVARMQDMCGYWPTTREEWEEYFDNCLVEAILLLEPCEALSVEIDDFCEVSVIKPLSSSEIKSQLGLYLHMCADGRLIVKSENYHVSPGDSVFLAPALTQELHGVVVNVDGIDLIVVAELQR